MSKSALVALEKDLTGIDEHFKDVIVPKLAGLEGKRKQRDLMSKLVFCVIFFGVWPYAGYKFWKHVLDGPWVAVPILLIVGLIFGVIVAGLIASTLTNGVLSDAKKILMGDITDFLGWTFKAVCDRPPFIEYLNEQKMFVGMTTETWEDQISGTALRHDFVMTEGRMISNVKINDKSTFDFKGMLLTLDFPKQFYSTTILRIKDNGFRWRSSAGLKAVGFASPEFNKKYEVFGNDAVEAQYLLAPDILATLIDIAKEFGGKLIAVFYHEGQLSIMITGKNRYEIKRSDVAFTDESRLSDRKKDIKALYRAIDRVEYYLTHRDPKNFTSG